LRGRYCVSRARPGFFLKLAYYGLDRAWAAAMDDAER
jgi:pilus assembly protein CpaF